MRSKLRLGKPAELRPPRKDAAPWCAARRRAATIVTERAASFDPANLGKPEFQLAMLLNYMIVREIQSS